MAFQKHVVYVPAKLATDARQIAIEHAGGVTLSPGHEGCWVDDSGKLHVDDITLVTVFERAPLNAALDRIIALLLDSGEQSVAFEVNGVPHLTTIRPEVRY